MLVAAAACGVKGRQNLEVLKGGEVIRETGFHDNMILDKWFEHVTHIGPVNNYPMQISTGSQLCVVGTGTAAPDPSQIRLTSFLASKQGADSGTTTQVSISATEVVWKRTRVWTFGLGAVVGNVSEMGTTITSVTPHATADLYTRALVLVQGNPGSISVAADEQLRVSHETITTVPLDIKTTIQSLLVNSVPTDFTIQYGFINGAYIADLMFDGTFQDIMGIDQGWTSYTFSATPGSAPSKSGAIYGQGYGWKTGSSGSQPAYNEVINISSLDTTRTGNIAGLDFSTFAGSNKLGVKFTPAVPKTNLNIFSLGFKFTFTRV